MAKQHLVIDAWIREAQEAERLVREIYDKVMSKNLEKQQGQKQKQQQRRVGEEIARSWLLEVGTDEDLESRWKMLSDLKLRTRALAVSLNAMPVPTLNRSNEGLFPQQRVRDAENAGLFRRNNPKPRAGQWPQFLYFNEFAMEGLQDHLHNSWSIDIFVSLGYSLCDRGIYILYEDVKSCQCEDVHVLWSILVESQTSSMPSHKTTV